jgi:hypothetical protein
MKSAQIFSYILIIIIALSRIFFHISNPYILYFFYLLLVISIGLKLLEWKNKKS